jgi:hypothetical protein
MINKETLDDAIDLISRLAAECNRLAEKYEPHPEITANSFDLSNLYINVNDFLSEYSDEGKDEHAWLLK